MILLRQRIYARQDYVGLDEAATAQLKAERSDIAKSLLKKRQRAQAAFNQNVSDINKAKGLLSGYSPNTNPESFFKNIEATHGTNISNKARELLTNDVKPMNDALSKRNDAYKKALGIAREDAKFERRDALKDTVRRTKIAEGEAALKNEEMARKIAMEKKASLRNAATNTMEKNLAKKSTWMKNAGKGALIVAGTAGLGYGIKKYFDSKKKSEASSNPNPTDTSSTVQ